MRLNYMRGPMKFEYLKVHVLTPRKNSPPSGELPGGGPGSFLMSYENIQGFSR